MYTTLQRITLNLNLVICLCWLFLLFRFALLYPLTGTRYLAGGIADFHIGVLAVTSIYEVALWLLIFKRVPKESNETSQFVYRLPRPRGLTLLMTILIRSTLCLVVLHYPKLTRFREYPFLILAQSIRESFKWLYQVYKVRYFSNTSPLLNWSKYLSFVFAWPIETVLIGSLSWKGLNFIQDPSQVGYIEEFRPFEKYLDWTIKLLLVVGATWSWKVFVGKSDGRKIMPQIAQKKDD
ncbi:hypothetical protein DAMA08_002090 [Martiniozyma asiatica (nom. inval.)]|nr:hypothetical protein DAMA08_002090 [Martiniozyma asiatica]